MQRKKNFSFIVEVHLTFERSSKVKLSDYRLFLGNLIEVGVKMGVNSLRSWKLTRFARGHQDSAIGETIVLRRGA